MNQTKLSWTHLVMGLPFLAGLGYLLFLPPQDIMQVDTQSYQTFHPTRTIGYPFFLWLIPLAWVAKVQLVIFCTSASIFAKRLLRVVGPFWTLLALGLILGHPELAKYHFQAMTESLTLSILLLILSEWILISQEVTLKRLLRLGIWLGLAILLRPSSYAFLTLLGLALFFLKWRQVLFAAIPTFILIQLGAFANYHIHGFWGTQSFLGHNLIGKVTFIMDEKLPLPAPYPELAKAVKPIQQVVSKAHTLQQRILLSGPYYDTTRFTLLPKLFPETQDWNHEWQQMSFATMRAHPLGYAEDVLMNYYSLWFYPQAMTHTQMFEFQHLLKEIEPLPYMTQYPYTLRSYPAWFLSTVRIAFLGAFLVSLGYLLAFLIRRKSSLIHMGAGASLLTHASYLVTAGTQAGLTRYAVLLWPAIALLSTFFAYQFWNSLKGRR